MIIWAKSPGLSFETIGGKFWDDTDTGTAVQNILQMLIFSTG